MASAATARSQRRERHDEVRAKVCEATLRLLEERPYRELTIDDVAREAGISRSAFYFYFRDKHELLMALTADVADALYREADRWWHGHGDPEALVREALSGVAAVYERYAPVLRVATEVSTYDEEVRQFWRSLVERFVDATTDYLRHEREVERVPPLDPRPTAEALVWMVERTLYIQVAGGERRPEELVATLVPLWVSVLYSDG
jgi:TetR/AcrR family transcriptional regulator, ethionamide resistance regulator